MSFLFAAGGFGVLSFIASDTSYLVLVVALVLLGAGMSLTAAPATGSIMSAVPHAKAGVGSAINDTTREVGGAIGIAVLGSISNAAYRSAVDLGNLSLPPPIAKAAGESVGAATALAERLPGGAELAARAGTAFTDSFNLASAVSAVLALAAAAIVARVFSRRSEQEAVADADPDKIAVGTAG